MSSSSIEKGPTSAWVRATAIVLISFVLVIYLLFPVTLSIAFEFLDEHELLSPAALENLETTYTPISDLQSAFPAYDDLVYRERRFCKEHGLLRRGHHE